MASVPRPSASRWHLLEHIQPGDEIEVWWPYDRQWYPGAVTERRPDGKYAVSYDDGDKEELHLWMEQWRFRGKAAERVAGLLVPSSGSNAAESRAESRTESHLPPAPPAQTVGAASSSGSPLVHSQNTKPPGKRERRPSSAAVASKPTVKPIAKKPRRRTTGSVRAKRKVSSRSPAPKLITRGETRPDAPLHSDVSSGVQQASASDLATKGKRGKDLTTSKVDAVREAGSRDQTREDREKTILADDGNAPPAHQKSKLSINLGTGCENTRTSRNKSPTESQAPESSPSVQNPPAEKRGKSQGQSGRDEHQEASKQQRKNPFLRPGVSSRMRTGSGLETVKPFASPDPMREQKSSGAVLPAEDPTMDGENKVPYQPAAQRRPLGFDKPNVDEINIPKSNALTNALRGVNTRAVNTPVVPPTQTTQGSVEPAKLAESENSKQASHVKPIMQQPNAPEGPNVRNLGEAGDGGGLGNGAESTTKLCNARKHATPPEQRLSENSESDRAMRSSGIAGASRGVDGEVDDSGVAFKSMQNVSTATQGTSLANPRNKQASQPTDGIGINVRNDLRANEQYSPAARNPALGLARGSANAEVQVPQKWSEMRQKTTSGGPGFEKENVALGQIVGTDKPLRKARLSTAKPDPKPSNGSPHLPREQPTLSQRRDSHTRVDKSLTTCESEAGEEATCRAVDGGKEPRQERVRVPLRMTSAERVAHAYSTMREKTANTAPAAAGQRKKIPPPGLADVCADLPCVPRKPAQSRRVIPDGKSDKPRGAPDVISVRYNVASAGAPQISDIGCGRNGAAGVGNKVGSKPNAILTLGADMPTSTAHKGKGRSQISATRSGVAEVNTKAPNTGEGQNQAAGGAPVKMFKGPGVAGRVDIGSQEAPAVVVESSRFPLRSVPILTTRPISTPSTLTPPGDVTAVAQKRDKKLSKMTEAVTKKAGSTVGTAGLLAATLNSKQYSAFEADRLNESDAPSPNIQPSPLCSMPLHRTDRSVPLGCDATRRNNVTRGTVIPGDNEELPSQSRTVPVGRPLGDKKSCPESDVATSEKRSSPSSSPNRKRQRAEALSADQNSHVSSGLHLSASPKVRGHEDEGAPAVAHYPPSTCTLALNPASPRRLEAPLHSTTGSLSEHGRERTVGHKQARMKTKIGNRSADVLGSERTSEDLSKPQEPLASNILQPVSTGCQNIFMDAVGQGNDSNTAETIGRNTKSSLDVQKNVVQPAIRGFADLSHAAPSSPSTGAFTIEPEAAAGRGLAAGELNEHRSSPSRATKRLRQIRYQGHDDLGPKEAVSDYSGPRTAESGSGQNCAGAAKCGGHLFLLSRGSEPRQIPGNGNDHFVDGSAQQLRDLPDGRVLKPPASASEPVLRPREGQPRAPKSPKAITNAREPSQFTLPLSENLLGKARSELPEQRPDPRVVGNPDSTIGMHCSLQESLTDSPSEPRLPGNRSAVAEQPRVAHIGKSDATSGRPAGSAAAARQLAEKFSRQTGLNSSAEQSARVLSTSLPLDLLAETITQSQMEPLQTVITPLSRRIDAHFARMDSRVQANTTELSKMSRQFLLPNVAAESACADQELNALKANLVPTLDSLSSKFTASVRSDMSKIARELQDEMRREFRTMWSEAVNSTSAVLRKTAEESVKTAIADLLKEAIPRLVSEKLGTNAPSCGPETLPFDGQPLRVSDPSKSTNSDQIYQSTQRGPRAEAQTVDGTAKRLPSPNLDSAVDMLRRSNEATAADQNVTMETRQLISAAVMEWLKGGRCRDLAPMTEREVPVSALWVKETCRKCLTSISEKLDTYSARKPCMTDLLKSLGGSHLELDWLMKGPSAENIAKARSNYSHWDPKLLDFEWESEKRVLHKLAEEILNVERDLAAKRMREPRPLANALKCIQLARARVGASGW